MQARKNRCQAQADQRQTGWFGHGSEIEITYEIQACVADMCDLVPGHRVNCEDISTEQRVPTTGPADE